MARRIHRGSSLALAVAAGIALGAARPTGGQDLGAVPGFIPPPLHPAGSELLAQRLSEGVYALVATKPGCDNNGFVVGKRGVLVIDANINGAMARRIQEAIRAVTQKPILYVVNTNYHGDHTFGNYAFPPSTVIVAHRATAAAMKDFEGEKRRLLRTVNGDTTVYADARLRLPDRVFDDSLRLDLGGRSVGLYHFGFGNTPGDVVVYVPDARAAWTGNLILGQGSIPALFEGHAREYRETVSRMAARLDIDTLIPGHGQPTNGQILTRYRAYLGDLLESVGAAIRAGDDLDAVLTAMPAWRSYAPDDSSRFALLLAGFHRLNLVRAYRELAPFRSHLAPKGE